MTDIDYLKKLISFKTDVNSNCANECIEYISSILKQYGWKIKLVKNECGENVNLIAVLNGELQNISNGLLLSGHIDTVVTNQQNWDTDPYSLTQKDDYLYGLGISDMKFFTACILANLDKINKLKLNKPLLISLTNDEETIMQGINAIKNFLKNNNIKPDYSIIGEPSNNVFIKSNKGFYEFETNILGKSCHSSTPKMGINSIYVMSKFISFIENLSKEYENYNTSINVGVIKGGQLCNIVPDKCTIRWDVRTSSREILSEITNKTNNFLDKLSVEYNSLYNNSVVFMIPVFEYVDCPTTQMIINKYGLEQLEYSGATEAGFFQELGINCIIYGAGDPNEAHSVNEKINLNNFVNYQGILLNLIKDLCC